MGAEGFHGRVRDGIGCLAPRYGHQAGKAPIGRGDVGRKCLQARPLRVVGPPPVHALLMPGASLAGIGVLALGAGDGVGEFKPIERLVPVSCAGCPASTSGLSTWWSSTALKETWF